MAGRLGEPTNVAPIDTHDIFLSHSGKQKGFVKGLFQMLSSSYTTFFDITHHSLPPAENFPSRIFHAAKKCRLAVVVLSNDFVISKWPMLELCTFVKSAPSVKILPLFYSLSPSDLKLQSNLEEWRKAWNVHAMYDSKRMNVLEWERALHSLCSLNGLIFDPSEGEVAYLKKIVSSISTVVPPEIKYHDSGIHGKDRLCKTILAKFAQLESMTPQPNVPPESRVCVLGMYGLPGSGKSTLSKCLCNHYSRYLHGKPLYLKLPTNATDEQLVNVCKDLFTRLTNFLNMVDLTNASELEQMYYLLSSSNLQSSNILLVVDNILEETLEFVQKILRFAVGVGSKVLLVARTLDVLHPLLDIDQQEKTQYVCSSLSVPSIDEKEAIRVLLQNRDAVGLVESCAPENDLSPRHREIMEKVILMSGFDAKSEGKIYLPLVLKLMGVQLRRYRLDDVDKWGRDMDSFWKRVEKCKEKAVMELVQKSFNKLTNHLQLLFLDLALFIIPSSYVRREALELLSFMHEHSLEDIEMDMHDLQSHCFLENVYCAGSSVHDVFLQFAASIPQSSMYYLRSRHGGRRNKADVLPRELPPPPNQSALRAVVLELNEGHERFDFWPGCSSVKALVLRNCRNLAVLGLVGLTSLVSLDINNCPCLKSVELPSGTGHWNGITRLKWVNEQGKNMVQLQQERSSMEIYVEQGKQLLRSAWSWISAMSRVPCKSPVGDLASQMRGLQILSLENTGIEHLGDMSRLWPLLKQLKVIEKSLDHIEVGNLPHLKSFIFSGDGSHELLYRESFFDKELKRISSARALMGKNLLAGCPELEEVAMCSTSSEDGLGRLSTSKLRILCLGNFWHAAKLPDLGASAQSLQALVALHCRELESVNFVYRFESLTEMSLQSCPSLAEVTGLDSLPSLYRLSIRDCINLQTLSGLSGLVSLEYFNVMNCANLQVLLSDLQDLTKLSDLYYYQHTFLPSTVFNVRNLKNLEDLVLCTNSGVFDAGMLMGLENVENLERLKLDGCMTTDEMVSCVETNCNAFLDLTMVLGVPESPSLSSIIVLELAGLQNLVSLNGVGFLPRLHALDLKNLQNLSCLQGIECLTNLVCLRVRDCVKLRCVEGCGAMAHLAIVNLIGCKSLACFPPVDDMNLSRLETLRIEGSKFASIEAMVSWVVEQDGPDEILREASLEALEWELCNNLRDKPREKRELEVRLVKTVGAELINRLIPNDDDCFDFDMLASEMVAMASKTLIPYPDAAVTLMRSMASVPKRCLIGKCQLDIDFIESDVLHSLTQTHPSLLQVLRKYTHACFLPNLLVRRPYRRHSL
ncbi:hypothetical protein L7F22_029049 [Adiantum nelumboides]|nr:hypothetical protein [Adiantum nelumboides]